MNELDKKYPEGHFTGMWIGIGAAIGSGLGVAFAIAIGNLAFMGIGLPIGVAIGAGIGAAQEAKHKTEGKIRSLNEGELKQRKVAMLTGFGLLLVGFLVLVGVFLSR